MTRRIDHAGMRVEPCASHPVAPVECPCPDCYGFGLVPDESKPWFRADDRMKPEKCPRCLGFGRVVRCPLCA